MTAFHIADPLPRPGATTLLEASAGTGKTWTIGALVTRYVAEGHATLDQLLVVTFGRAASQELRERVRSQLVAAERALADPDTTADSDGLDDVIALLLADPDQRQVRRRRLRDALAGFDAATIATTHQFCQMVLRSLGVAGDTDANATLVEDLDDLLAEVVDDLYLRRFADAPEQPPFSRADALALGRAAAGDPQARLEPSAPDTGSAGDGASPPLPAQRVAFARDVRSELDRRKRRLGLLSYDDLLSQLAHALRQPDAPARHRMRQRWKVVLVDEFQDTDPVQWQVLDRAFSGHATMVLIGDPKQAIYAFRGGDVTTYLQAAATATSRQTLATNRRSDAALLSSLQAVLRGAALGDDQIVVGDVDAVHQGSRLERAGAPFRLRVVRHEDLGRRPGARLAVKDVRSYVVEDVARDIKRLLTSGATWCGERLRPRDVAVLAFRNDDLQAIQRALAAIGVPAVVAGSGSVFGTPAATEWLRLLEALEQPHRSGRVRSAALTSFLGHTAVELDEQGDALTDRVADKLRDWAELHATRGVAAVLEAAIDDGLYATVLARVDGERLLTDLRHIGQALHQVAVEERLGPVALLTWLRGQMAEDKLEVASERTRRLDSDAAAVQLVTIHGSKGLEYPVVYVPTLWDRFPQKPKVPRYHATDADAVEAVDPLAVGTRCIDVGSGGPGWDRHLRQAMTEDDGESLRLLYVALTRARSQVVAWWAPAPKNTPCSPLQRMLFGRLPGWSTVPAEMALHEPQRVHEILDHWQEIGGPCWEPAAAAALPAEALEEETRPLDARRFTRRVDTAWRRTSYTALSTPAVPGTAGGATSAAGGAGGAGSEPEERPRDDDQPAPSGSDEAVLVAGGGPGEARAGGEATGDVGLPSGAVLSPMAGLPVGATFGSLVHAVLELADPGAEDLRAELLTQVEEQRVRWPVDLDSGELADALLAVCHSPLGPLAAGTTLARVGRRDRLCELDFELPLSGGDLRDYPGLAATPVRLGDLAPLLRAHLPADDPVRPYADALDDPGLGDQDLRGYLTGSVDVVLRLGDGHGEGDGDGDGQPRYLVVDYKTNWLGAFPGEGGPPLSSEDYRPAALAEAMAHSDYPLQALLYAVVLHRFLRWRQPGYDPDRHLGGVLYLYLRGMCGADTPLVDGRPCGVFSWRPPSALVVAVSDLLDGAAVPDRVDAPEEVG
ncbi:MAG TPA: UvrD-helicase domain-containing protein [Nocardioidaceae bacterium]|nr:UvrD-helicase domain-containing protein [Nocardioidaceae bacterium]